MAVILYNSLDKIYKNGITEEAGEFICTVCGKKYKRESTANNHIEKMNCHTMKNIFQDTKAEGVMYDIFISLLAIEGKRCLSMKKFRTSKLYTPIAKFMLFCNTHKIQNQYEYLTFVLENTYWKFINAGVNNTLKESSLVEYRLYKVKNENEYSEKFYNSNSERLHTDTSFVLRSLERGDISYSYLFTCMDFDKFVDRLSGTEIERLEQILLVANKYE